MATLMRVPLDATHYARLIEGYLCVNEHGAAHARLPHADWLKSTDSHSIDNATRQLPRNGAPARYFRELSATDLMSNQGFSGSSRSYSFLTTA
jgi:hypothetical protein